MSQDDLFHGAVDRRNLLRVGTLMAAGGAAAFAATAAPTAASADDGDPALIGEDNVGNSTTSLTLGGLGGNAQPTLALGNANGPALRLEPLAADWSGPLSVGDVVGTRSGPLVGVELNGGTTNTRLVTELELENRLNERLDRQPMTIAVPPTRIVDTRLGADAEVNGRILRSSPAAFDEAHRLKSRSWMDVALVETGEGFTLGAVFCKVTSVGSLATGFLTIYPPGPRPFGSSANYSKGNTTGTAAFVACGIVQDFFVLRLFVSRTTHVVVDVTGALIQNEPVQSPAAIAYRRRSAQAVEQLQRALEKS